MVLVDTSVWIRHLTDQAPFADRLEHLLDRGEVAGHDLVYGELLIGDKGGRVKLLADYQRLHHAAVVPHSDVVEFVRDQKLHGRGVGWIDVQLLASALVSRMQLWTADPRFAAVAKELGIAW
jgi:predicted nucleic acid-binding protein